MPWLFIAGLVCVAACGAAPDSSRPPSEIHQITEEDAVARFGSDSRDEEVFSRIVDANLSRSGRFAVILDQAAPFVHVFDRHDGSAWTFGAAGEGPGELHAPYSLELVGDTALLIPNRNGIDRFDFKGTWKKRHSPHEFGLLVTAITTGCRDRVFVYGRPGRGASSDTVSWLHELRWDTTPPTTVALDVWGAMSPVRFGSVEGFDATDEGILLWQRSDWSHAGWWLPCSSLAPTRLTSRSVAHSRVEKQVMDSERTAVTFQPKR